MAKINMGSGAGLQKPAQTGGLHEKGDRVLSLIHSGMQDINVLANTISTINSTISSRKTTDTDNAVKISKAKADVKKEENRHSEEMAKIDQQWKKIAHDAEDRERRLSFIQGQIQRFQAEYDKYMAMEIGDFLSDTVTSRLESLRKVIMELTKELNRM